MIDFFAYLHILFDHIFVAKYPDLNYIIGDPHYTTSGTIIHQPRIEDQNRISVTPVHGVTNSSNIGSAV